MVSWKTFFDPFKNNGRGKEPGGRIFVSNKGGPGQRTVLNLIVANRGSGAGVKRAIAREKAKAEALAKVYFVTASGAQIRRRPS